MDKPDILLIQPSISVSERYGRDVGDVGGYLPPLSLAMVAAVLKENNFKVGIIDSVVMNYSEDDVLSIVKENMPKVVGITSITPTYHRAKSLAGRIREKFPDILLVIGGHHVTIMPERVLEETSFDIGVLGEGEATIVELLKLFKSEKYDLKKLISGKKLENVDGIVFRSDNRVLLTKPRKLLEDLNALPYPARELLPMEKYIPLPNQYKRKPVVHMTAIRGCPYSCSFCSNNKIFGRKIRFRSPEKIVEEIKYVKKKYGAREISFWDDMMTVNREWINSFCDLLIKDDVGVVWTCYARVDSVDEPMLRKMKKAGCWNIFFGFESGVQMLLDNINKGITIEQIRRTNELCKRIGIEVRASFMIALPGETPELARETIEFAKKLNPDYVQFCITTPYPGTALYNDSKKYGKLTEDFSKYSIWEPVFIPSGYKNAEEIQAIEKTAMREFYIRPRYILSRINKINSMEDILRYFKGFRLMLGFTQKKVTEGSS
jgi:anaerobic magnesium-protoporphyrin IX monomethyl ester cyclase